MKEWIRKISVTLVLAVCELLLGLLLLINPVGLGGFVIILMGILLLALGTSHLYRYLRMPREEAAGTWLLASGACFVTLGLVAIINQHWLVQILGTLTALYGIITLVSAFLKLQMAVDAFRSSRGFWYLMAISFLVSAILSTLLFINPFAGNTLWIVSGVLLLALAVLDTVYFALGRKKKG